jgi:Tol biopolymer transport system component
VGLRAMPRWSPDGRTLAFYLGRGLGPTRIYVANADGSRRREIVRGSRINFCLNPVWSPDGKKLACTVDCDLDFMSIFVVNRDGTGRKELTPRNWSFDPAWRPKSRTILFLSTLRDARGNARGAFRLFLMNADGSNRRQIRGNYPEPDPSRLGEGPGPEWSPDGNEIYFLSNRALNVMKANGTQLWKLTPAGMTTGNFELSPNGRMIAVSGATRGARPRPGGLGDSGGLL